MQGFTTRCHTDDTGDNIQNRLGQKMKQKELII